MEPNTAPYINHIPFIYKKDHITIPLRELFQSLIINRSFIQVKKDLYFI